MKNEFRGAIWVDNWQGGYCCVNLTGRIERTVGWVTEERCVYQRPPQMRAWLDSHAGQVALHFLACHCGQAKTPDFWHRHFPLLCLRDKHSVQRRLRRQVISCGSQVNLHVPLQFLRKTKETCAISSLFHTLKCRRCYFVVNSFSAGLLSFSVDLSFSFSLDRELIPISKLYQQLIEIQERFLENVPHEIRNIQIKTTRWGSRSYNISPAEFHLCLTLTKHNTLIKDTIIHCKCLLTGKIADSPCLSVIMWVVY